MAEQAGYSHPGGKGAGKYNGMKKASDWKGCRVKAVRDIRNRGGDAVKAGAVGEVSNAYSGLRVTFEKCVHCGTVLHVTHLSYTDVELA